MDLAVSPTNNLGPLLVMTSTLPCWIFQIRQSAQANKNATLIDLVSKASQPIIHLAFMVHLLYNYLSKMQCARVKLVLPGIIM